MTRQKQIIDKFTESEQPPVVRKLFSQWLSSPIDAEQKNRALEELWEATSSYSKNTEQALKQTRRRLFGQRETKQPVWRTAFYRAVAAAIIIPLITAAASWLYISDIRTHRPEWTQVSVPCGERRHLALADGTQLWLGAGTRVIYPTAFNGDERKIFVDGELFAEVAHDSEHPFIVATGDADIRVLGTTFGLRAYNNDSEIELMLVEGSVRFDIDSPKYVGHIMMKPNDMVRYNRTSGKVEQSTFNGDNYHSWARDGSIYFFNEPLGSIAAQLSRRFDRQIVITDAQLLSIRFHVFLSGTESLDDVMKVFTMNRSIRVTERNDIIYIRRKN